MRCSDFFHLRKVLWKKGLERPRLIRHPLDLSGQIVVTIIGANHRGSLMTLVDQKFTLTLLETPQNRYSESIITFIGKVFKRLRKGTEANKTMIHNFNFENGPEFSKHLDITFFRFLVFLFFRLLVCIVSLRGCVHGIGSYTF